ncbi:hypothetical protein C4J81_00095 [Deltaproteobacteria bacterium Smac51]|nr:hypothetical protein C4J81_00095 [Deltaproteobacteria bacterium Smac51]
MAELRILLADDEAIVRAFIKRVIEDERLPVAEVLEAADGLEAARLALSAEPDLAIVDNRMPGLSGLKVCELIHKEKPGIQVVILSAHDEFENVRKAFTSGALDYVLKPVHHKQIAELILNAAARLGAGESPERPVRDEGGSLIKAVKDYIEENIETELLLTDISRAVFSSPYHLSRKFKKITGQPLKDYIFSRRMTRALELLKNADLSITEVAAMVGFNSSSYFATCFKAHTGRSPSRHRQK